MRYRVTHSTKYGYDETIPLVSQCRSHAASRTCGANLPAAPVGSVAGPRRPNGRLRLFRKPCDLVQPARAAHGPADRRPERSASPSVRPARKSTKGLRLGRSSPDSASIAPDAEKHWRRASSLSSPPTFPGPPSWPSYALASFISARPAGSAMRFRSHPADSPRLQIFGGFHENRYAGRRRFAFRGRASVRISLICRFAACARLGFSARYVSGYMPLYPPPGHERLTGAERLARMGQRLCAAAPGWVDFDPTNWPGDATPMGIHHADCAWGRDYDGTSARQVGNLDRRGGHRHWMDVSVDVVPVGVA